MYTHTSDACMNNYKYQLILLEDTIRFIAKHEISVRDELGSLIQSNPIHPYAQIHILTNFIESNKT